VRPLQELLGNPQRSGIMRYAGSADELESNAKAAGLAVHKIDLAAARGKKGWIDALAGALKFPGYFGANWDALDECLRDLQWIDAKGWLLLITNGATFSTKNRRIWKTALTVMQSGAEHWRAEGKPFWVVFLDVDQSALPELPELTAN